MAFRMAELAGAGGAGLDLELELRLEPRLELRLDLGLALLFSRHGRLVPPLEQQALDRCDRSEEDE